MIKKIIRDPFCRFILLAIILGASYSIHGWMNDECNDLTKLLGCGYDETKHICTDWECGYFNPFGASGPQFRLSQINRSYFNWTGAEHCPLYEGQYCYKDICTPNPLTIENCVEWEKRK